MEPTWGPSGAGRTQVGPMLAPWTLLSGYHYQNYYNHHYHCTATTSPVRCNTGNDSHDNDVDNDDDDDGDDDDGKEDGHDYDEKDDDSDVINSSCTRKAKDYCTAVNFK